MTPVLLAVLFGLALYDHRHYRLPDAGTLSLLVAGLVLAAVRSAGLPWPELVGASVGFAVFWGFGAVYHRLTGVDGLGLGDAKMLGAAGAWLGWGALPALVLVAAVLGLVSAVVLQRQRREAVAFGPGLAVSFAALWLLRLSTGWPSNAL